jgi:predicted lipoprotein with Yx(FWY)xxD motif
MMRTSRARSSISLLAATGVLAIVAAACSASTTGGSAAASAAAPSAAAPSAAASAAASGAAGVYEVDVATGAVGKYLTGEDGKTLYVFTADSANKATCTATCSNNWPAFTLDTGESVTPGAGVTGSLTTFTNADGKMQVAINGLPLYYFAKDSKAGDTNGEGIGGKWFVADPAGMLPAASGAPAASATPSSAPKY